MAALSQGAIEASFNAMNWPGISFTPIDSHFVALDKAFDDLSSGLHRFSHSAMACEWGLWIAGDSFDYADQVAFEAWTEVERLENELSRFILSSDIHQLNFAAHHRDSKWLQIGAATMECLQLSIEIHRATDGAFDITLGSLLDARRNDDGTVRPAKEEEAQEARRSGMEWLEIDEENGAARVTHPDVRLDLGAIGKGYALDRIALILRDWSIQNALMHAGQSSVLAIGAPPNSEAWEVALRQPMAKEESESKLEDRFSAEMGKILLRDRAVSGSGMALQGDHIIDPRNGRAARGKSATWALASSAALSDAASTAFMVMQATEIASFCQSHVDVDALLIEDDGTPHFFGVARGELGDNRDK